MNAGCRGRRVCSITVRGADNDPLLVIVGHCLLPAAIPLIPFLQWLSLCREEEAHSSSLLTSLVLLFLQGLALRTWKHRVSLDVTHVTAFAAFDLPSVVHIPAPQAAPITGGLQTKTCRCTGPGRGEEGKNLLEEGPGFLLGRDRALLVSIVLFLLLGEPELCNPFNDFSCTQGMRGAHNASKNWRMSISLWKSIQRCLPDVSREVCYLCEVLSWPWQASCLLNLSWTNEQQLLFSTSRMKGCC